VEHRASMKSFQALRSPAIRLTSCHNLPVFLISSSIVLHCPYNPKPYSGFPFHTKGVAFYIRLFILQVSIVYLYSIFKVYQLLAYSIRSQWWGCHQSPCAGWFSVGFSSPSLWRSPFSTRQWCWFWSTLGILFSQYPLYLVSLPLFATWGGARWETSNSTRESGR
jgi:hypothetical protein